MGGGGDRPGMVMLLVVMVGIVVVEAEGRRLVGHGGEGKRVVVEVRGRHGGDGGVV